MKSKRMMLVCIVAVLALALMGFGFAKWADTVNIEGNVATGTVEVSIDAIDTDDENGADPNVEPGENTEGKDVASCTIENATTDEFNKAVKVTIGNAYPWYSPTFTFKIKGEGTVPVKVENVTGPVWTNEDGKNLGEFIKVEQWEIVVNNPEESNGVGGGSQTYTSGEGNTDWDGLAEALKYIQLHQDGTIDVSVQIYIEEDGATEGAMAPQDATSTGTITIDVAQWNEVEGTKVVPPVEEPVN